MHNIMKTTVYLSLLVICTHYTAPAQNTAGAPNNATPPIDVAAYFWPSLQNEARSRETLWGDGIGEWEVIKQSEPRFEGHYQPRQPLNGYTLDDEPAVMEQQIEEATDHGVNVFIFDWYWYGGEPFLEEALNDGFLQAKNKDDMRFYLMWANHDVPGNMWNPYRYQTDSLLYEGSVTQPEYEALVERIITNYFAQPNYYTIDNQPVFSLYSLEELIQSFTDVAGVKRALDYFEAEAVKAGFDGIHWQLVGKYGPDNVPSLGEGYLNVAEVVEQLDANSVTMYNMAGNEYRTGDYLPYLRKSLAMREQWDTAVSVPFVPCVSVGWDNTPRYLEMGKEKIIYYHNTPASFGAGLLKAKQYVRDRPEQPPLIIINAWNEWVEGSYLRPDLLNGYGYLEEVKEMMREEED